jgi:hypothetical protein
MSKIFTGFSISKNLTLLSKDKAIDKQTGMIVPVGYDILLEGKFRDASPQITKEVEVVVGVDKQKINLSLKSHNGNLPAPSGFLIEVYLSGSDGKLSRVYMEDVVDIVNDEILSEGFSNYLNLEVDKDD